jgi:hypothetical protein
MWRVMAGIGVGLLLFGCGGGGLSLTGYVDRLNVIDGRTVPQMEVLISELERSTTPNTVAPEPKQEIHAGQVARISGVGYALAVFVVLVECQISRHG